MSGWLQISAGEFFEWMLPASFALTALLSAWVLASARKRRLNAAVTTLWTLSTLFFPLVVLPLYLVFRFFQRRDEPQKKLGRDETTGNPESEKSAPPAWRHGLPLVYLVLLLSLGALYFYTDYRSVDAHLARANQARVRGQQERIIEEYRAALRLEDNAHTHNLLGRELAATRRWDEALRELRTAERMGETDDELPYYIAESLYNLARFQEAAPEFERFLRSSTACTTPPRDVRCILAERRLTDIAGRESR